jgi:hypothetical protein
MANQRKKGVTRITLTISDEMLERIEAEAARRAELDAGFDRLGFIREAILEKLEEPVQPPKSTPNES